MAESRGRPIGSDVRKNIVDILHHMGSGYGYEIHKAYKEIFSPVTLRTIYYHLKKGLELGIFEVDEVEDESGDYSWGQSAEKTYYSLTEKANPRPNEKVEEFFED